MDTKQLKELDADIEEFKARVFAGQIIVANLKAENERLKKDYESVCEEKIKYKDNQMMLKCRVIEFEKEIDSLKAFADDVVKTNDELGIEHEVMLTKLRKIISEHSMCEEGG